MFIDKQGKLFGKINLIDFLVLLFILFLMPIFYFGYKIFTTEPKPQDKPIPPLIRLKDKKAKMEKELKWIKDRIEEFEPPTVPISRSDSIEFEKMKLFFRERKRLRRYLDD